MGETTTSPTGARRRAVGRAGGVVLEAGAAFAVWLCGWLAVWVLVPTLVAGLLPVMVTSGSMGPVIAPGDVVLVREVPAAAADELGPGTVVTFRRGGEHDLVTHRIEAVREDGAYRTRGDANPSPDSTPVDPSDVVGVGTLLVPFVGLPRLWLEQRSPLLAGWVAAMLAALLVLQAAPAGSSTSRPETSADQPDHLVAHGVRSTGFAAWLVELPGWAIPATSGLVALALVVLWSLA